MSSDTLNEMDKKKLPIYFFLEKKLEKCISSVSLIESGVKSHEFGKLTSVLLDIVKAFVSPNYILNENCITKIDSTIDLCFSSISIYYSKALQRHSSIVKAYLHYFVEVLRSSEIKNDFVCKKSFVMTHCKKIGISYKKNAKTVTFIPAIYTNINIVRTKSYIDYLSTKLNYSLSFHIGKLFVLLNNYATHKGIIYKSVFHNVIDPYIRDKMKISLDSNYYEVLRKMLIFLSSRIVSIRKIIQLEIKGSLTVCISPKSVYMFDYKNKKTCNICFIDSDLFVGMHKNKYHSGDAHEMCMICFQKIIPTICPFCKQDIEFPNIEFQEKKSIKEEVESISIDEASNLISTDTEI